RVEGVNSARFSLFFSATSIACGEKRTGISTQRVSCALPTPALGYDEHWRHIIGSRSRGRLFWLRVEGVNSGPFSLFFSATSVAFGEKRPNPVLC
ncbi:MAG: hypothetical protein O7C62_06320, partial [Rickettsia endosymbiont of Ixodes persulcatus]|nr:hypothetical protein [Rickettsia endosymbiont of Ixodes persulcatus]